MLNNNAQIEKLKRKGESLDNGVTIFQHGDIRHIQVQMARASHKGKKWASMSLLERRAFEDLLYLSNVQQGNPKIVYV
jgi:hypothetical protein